MRPHRYQVSSARQHFPFGHVVQAFVLAEAYHQLVVLAYNSVASDSTWLDNDANPFGLNQNKLPHAVRNQSEQIVLQIPREYAVVGVDDQGVLELALANEQLPHLVVETLGEDALDQTARIDKTYLHLELALLLTLANLEGQTPVVQDRVFLEKDEGLLDDLHPAPTHPHFAERAKLRPSCRLARRYQGAYVLLKEELVYHLELLFSVADVLSQLSKLAAVVVDSLKADESAELILVALEKVVLEREGVIVVERGGVELAVVVEEEPLELELEEQLFQEMFVGLARSRLQEVYELASHSLRCSPLDLERPLGLSAWLQQQVSVPCHLLRVQEQSLLIQFQVEVGVVAHRYCQRHLDDHHLVAEELGQVFEQKAIFVYLNFGGVVDRGVEPKTSRLNEFRKLKKFLDDRVVVNVPELLMKLKGLVLNGDQLFIRLLLENLVVHCQLQAQHAIAELVDLQRLVLAEKRWTQRVDQQQMLVLLLAKENRGQRSVKYVDWSPRHHEKLFGDVIDEYLLQRWARLEKGEIKFEERLLFVKKLDLEGEVVDSDGVVALLLQLLACRLLGGFLSQSELDS